jgi:hypothetical protein
MRATQMNSPDELVTMTRHSVRASSAPASAICLDTCGVTGPSQHTVPGSADIPASVCQGTVKVTRPGRPGGQPEEGTSSCPGNPGHGGGLALSAAISRSAAAA